MKHLTDKQKLVYEFITKRIGEGISPTIREICAGCNIKSTSSVSNHLKRLESMDLIIRDSNLNRSIRLSNHSTQNIPLLGVVTAGLPILAVENITDYIPFKLQNRRSGKDLFALSVRGESMIEAGILDGDIVVVLKTPTASNGEIVVAMIDDEATVKRFFKEKGRFRLQPENPEFEPIITDEVTILGRVISLIRNY